MAGDGDDEEVKAAFALHADETRSQHERLQERLREMGGSASGAKGLSANVFSSGPKASQIPHVEEERTVQNLIAAYTMEASECAMYEALIHVARAAGDQSTAALACDIQKEEHQTADKLWHFLRSRSIIAYNMLTITEIDPSIETKVGEASWTP